jgi:hypothetical protein
MRRGPSASMLLALLGGALIGCGQTEQPAKAPGGDPNAKKAMYEQQQQKMQESMKEHGMQGTVSDKDKDKDNAAKDEK